MALTATPQSALPRERAWDEVIVPTLRKRLEDESHLLSKRMSAASITSMDDDHPLDSYHANVVYLSRDKIPSPVYQSVKPSAIPRPSLQHSRTDTSSSSIARSSGSGSFKRSRTLSQPFPFEPTNSNGTSPPLPQQPSRSNSPMTSARDIKTTRIPVSRGRTGSTSSNQPSINGVGMIRSESRNGPSKLNGHTLDPPADLWPVSEAYLPPSSVNSRSTIRTPRPQVSELVNERAPFSAGSVSSHGGGRELDLTPPRPSNDSEERPFEHWYRGDVSRNGGVGELRVGRRQEMLDIANYGHTLRQASSRIAFSASSRSRSNSRGREAAMEELLRKRPRAGSLGARQSIYIDDDEQAQNAEMVLDEQPLTDLDSDGDGEMDTGEDEDMTERTEFSPPPNSSISSPQPTRSRSDTPTSSREPSKSGATFKTRIPTPTPRAITDPPRTPTPTQAPRGASEPPPSLPSGSSPKAKAIPHSHSQPGNSTVAGTTKRRAKSPASTVASSASKRTKTSKSPPKQVKKSAKEEARRSVAHYPAPDGDDITHAIPSWTQPVEASGNWDDVVLPVVARKKGLDGHYETADGSPRPKPPAPTVYEPAPGTFGFDRMKYRPPRTDRNPEDIPMDEFGQRNYPIQEEASSPEDDNQQPSITPDPSSPLPERNTFSRARMRPSPPPSPMPFAHYAANHNDSVDTLPQITVTRASMDVNKHVDEKVDEEGGAGCCKCVIM